MDKKKQTSKTSGGQRSNNAMPPQGKTPNRDSNKDDKDLRRKSALSDESDPELDEQDLEENSLSEDDADRVEWDPQSSKNKESGI